MSIASGLNYATGGNLNNSFHSGYDLPSQGYGVQPQFNTQFYSTHMPHVINPLENGHTSYFRKMSEDISGTHYQQLIEATKTITKQDDMIQNLRREIRRLQDIVAQKDCALNLKNLETTKCRETIEMLQFD